MAIAGSLILLLLAGNAFFVRGLISEIKKANTTSAEAALAIGTLTEKINEMKTEVKDLRKLEVEVAVLKSHLSPGPHHVRANALNPSDT